MLKKFNLFCLSLSFVGAIVFLSSCSSLNPSNSLSTPLATSPSICNPIIIGIAYDQTGSMRWSGTSSLEVEDLKPFISHLSNCGGEIGVTFVRANSAKPIERLRFPELPMSPAEPTQKTDEEDYEFTDRKDVFSEEVKNWEKEVQRLKSEKQPEIVEYFNVLKPLLAAKPKGNTDFWSGISRLDVYLSESDVSWRVKPHRYLVVVSDGEDNIGKEKRPFKSEATVIWVNANASGKSLQDFPYQRVENFQAAVKQILAKEGVK